MGDEFALFSGDDVPERPQEAEELLKQRDPKHGILSFHTGVEESLLLFIEREAEDGDPEAVLSAVDRFCYSQHWMMHCGDKKAEVLETALREQQDVVGEEQLRVLELGTYCGYSALRLARTLRDGDTLLSVDVNASCQNWAGRLLTKAGMLERVSFLLGSVPELHEREELQGHFDFVFLDHSKERYLPDLRFLEEKKLLSPGCRVVADNVLMFQPLTEYLEHVRDPEGPFLSSRLYEGLLEYSAEEDGVEDGVEVSVYR